MSNVDFVATLGVIVTLIAVVSPILRLNSNIVKLNANFENMLKSDEIRDKRLDQHGREINDLLLRQQANEKVLDLHELRIDNLENSKGDK